MNILLHSDDKLSCPDHCIYDSGTACINKEDDKILHICERFSNTELAKLIGNVVNNNITGFKASNDNGETWFEWYWNDYYKAWMVDEPESLAFSTEAMLANKGNYSRCVPTYK